MPAGGEPSVGERNPNLKTCAAESNATGAGYRIARAHDAAIVVTSAGSFGSTFEVKFKAVSGRVLVSAR
ncbi:MAG TPA: hypothetical protein VG297_19745 [Bryobacteraceae bacterium]|nr:hypothetical protein [Bryobacteraceae bacterium]